MERLQIFLITLIIFCAFGCGSKSQSNVKEKKLSDSIIANSCPDYILPDSVSRFFNLFLGMNKDDDNNYTQADSILDNIKGIAKMDKRTFWYYTADSIKYYASFGLYVDTVFPTKDIQKAILRLVDSLADEAIDLNAESDNRKFSETFDNNISTKILLKHWEELFYKATEEHRNTLAISSYNEILEWRNCIVAHRIYENDTIITYTIQHSMDIHGSCGCPSSADFITFNKQDGHVMQIHDIYRKYGKETVEHAVEQSYIKDSEIRGNEPHLTYKELLWNEETNDGKHGVAQIGDYILIYHQPYTIGCGAEGQYNLIIQMN